MRRAFLLVEADCSSRVTSIISSVKDYRETPPVPLKIAEVFSENPPDEWGTPANVCQDALRAG
jgi:hypothetical protein